MSTLSLRKIKHDSSAVDNITLTSDGNVLLCGASDAITSNGLVGKVVKAESADNIIIVAETNNTNRNLVIEHRTSGRSTIERDAQIVMGDDGSAGGRFLFQTATSGSDVVTRLGVDASGCITMPYQPAFSAGFDNNTGYTNFTGTMLWNNIISNVGSYYNASNGRFTAPVAGNYFFAWNCLTADNNLYVELNLNKNGSVIVRTQQDGGTNQIGGQILIPLAVGDYVTIVATSNGTSTVYIGGSGVTYNQFSGFLVG